MAFLAVQVLSLQSDIAMLTDTQAKRNHFQGQTNIKEILTKYFSVRRENPLVLER